MYILITPQEYPVICKMRRRAPKEDDQVSTTAKKSDGGFIFRVLSEEEKRIERMQQSIVHDIEIVEDEEDEE